MSTVGKKLKVGQEVIRKSRCGISHVYVAVDYDSVKKRTIVKRKAVLIGEILIGRPLTHGEQSQLIFKDGNRLNCSLQNIFVLRTRVLLICCHCMTWTVRYFSESRRIKNHRCSKCKKLTAINCWR